MNGSYEVKKWLVILTVISFLFSFGYSVAMTVNILPLISDIGKAIQEIEQQKIKINELNMDLAIVKNNYEHIVNQLSEIKELLKYGRKN